MPIAKIPIVHKFGIISHSQRLELQERLLKQSYAQSATERKFSTTRNPLEVTEGFVHQFNNAKSLSEKERLEELATKMLMRIKRRAGLREGGSGKNVNLPLAWTELSQLAQCKGKMQEDCLDVLITSLDQAPLSKQQVPALFFLAETTLYWLRTDAINQPYLRTAEIKLLKMGQLVFGRLFYHHMAGQLQGHNEFKNRLFTYLDGFGESQDVYSPYPNALLYVRFINEVGKIIIGDANLDAGELKEGDKIPSVQNAGSLKSTNLSVTVDTAPESVSTRETNDEELFPDTSEHNAKARSSSARSGAISSSVHDLSPTLWHALDVWRCTSHLGGGLEDALKSLAHCGLGLAGESWVDGVIGLNIIAEAAKVNIAALKVMQNLAGCKAAPTSVHTPRTSEDPGPPQTTKTQRSHGMLSDIYEKSEPTSTPGKPTTAQQNLSPIDPAQDMPPGLRYDQVGSRNQLSDSPQKVTRESQRKTSTRQTMATGVGTPFTDPAPATAWWAEAGSDLEGAGRRSQASSAFTYGNAPIPELQGLHGWNWEVAITYTELLSEICLYGSTSILQKTALVGTNKDVEGLHKKGTAAYPMKSTGLLDLLYFVPAQTIHTGDVQDWSWRVRYTAIQGLVKICRCLAGDANREGLKTVAWNALLKAHSLEKDLRVLEALKVGQVEASIEKLLSQSLISHPSTISCKIAAELSKVYLPPLPPLVTSPPKKSPRPKAPIVSPKGPDTSRQPKRTTLKQEIMLATALEEPQPTFNQRTSFDLKRIVEDQWRKELQNQLEEEEKQRQKELEEKQKQDEEEQRLKEEHKKEKLSRNRPLIPKNTTNKPQDNVLKKNGLDTQKIEEYLSNKNSEVEKSPDPASIAYTSENSDATNSFHSSQMSLGEWMANKVEDEEL
ncbi:unnamed protein product [Owenia fusiformis]|uniref:Uncharacterized protein n=1 Tax=Owenia fusiformis TaxID=6347 RepID=A0A8J1XRY1_OWEFU|nr:unnamed protein product [Owenia fusiformis]